MDSGEKYTTTPLKSEGSLNTFSRRQTCDRNVANSYKTPVRCNEGVAKTGKLLGQSSFRGSLIKKMPIYSPPTDVNGYVKNPFEDARFLKERLSQPMCSPSVFERIISPIKANESDQFNWTIEDISTLRPAPINENPSQDFDSWFSPATENEAQRAINKFFSNQIVNMESPIDVRQSRVKDENPKKDMVTAETWSQTILSFPTILPPEIEKILSNYYSFNGDQCAKDNEDLNISSCSNSRKKLSFESVENDTESICNSPIQLDSKCSQQSVSMSMSSMPTSPELSPILLDKIQSSPMDVSMTYRSKTRLDYLPDVSIKDYENVNMMNWKAQDGVASMSFAEGSDCRFSSP